MNNASIDEKIAFYSFWNGIDQRRHWLNSLFTFCCFDFSAEWMWKHEINRLKNCISINCNHIWLSVANKHTKDEPVAETFRMFIVAWRLLAYNFILNSTRNFIETNVKANQFNDLTPLNDEFDFLSETNVCGNGYVQFRHGTEYQMNES